MKELLIRISTSILLICGLYFAYISKEFFYFLFITICLFAIFEFAILIIKIKKKIIERYILLGLGLIYLIVVNFYLFSETYYAKNIIFYFIIICIVTDIGGFTFGKIFKGKKLTKISPKKTFAGFYGSFIFSFLTMFIFGDYLNLNYFILFIFTVSVCLLSQFGDLLFSYLKRKANVKDSGKLLPGHGGILDRVDGMIISVPINIFLYTLST